MSCPCLYHTNELANKKDLDLPLHAVFILSSNMRVPCVITHMENYEPVCEFQDGVCKKGLLETTKHAYKLANAPWKAAYAKHHCLHLNLRGEDVLYAQFNNRQFTGSGKLSLDGPACQFSIYTKAEKQSSRRCRAVNLEDAPQPMDIVCARKKKKADVPKASKKRKTYLPPKEESYCLTDSEDEAEDICNWTPDKDEWTDLNVRNYILKTRHAPDKLPELLQISQVFWTRVLVNKVSNPIFECVFQHPNGEERIVNLCSTLMSNTPKYSAMANALV